MARRRGGGTGRRGGLKHRWGQPRSGSNPDLGTNDCTQNASICGDVSYGVVGGVPGVGELAEVLTGVNCTATGYAMLSR